MGLLYLDSDINWLKASGLVDLKFVDKYINTFYFSIISMITVGYGDITPKSSIEKLYVTFITILSCGVFAYSVNTSIILKIKLYEVGGIF